MSVGWDDVKDRYRAVFRENLARLDAEVRGDATAYRIRTVEKIDRSMTMRNVKGNVRERAFLEFILERNEGGSWIQVRTFSSRAAAEESKKAKEYEEVNGYGSWADRGKS